MRPIRTAGIAGLIASCAASRPSTVFDRMVDAVNAGDARGYASVYSEDATIVIHGGEELIGRAAIERHEVELLRQFPGARLALHAVWQDGDRAVVHYAVRGETPAGQAMGHEGLLFYRLDEAGRIASEHRYLDSLTPMAQLGALDARHARALPELPGTTRYLVSAGSSAERANVEVVRASLAAWLDGDREEFLATVADGVVVDELMLPQTFSGKEAVSQWLVTWAGAARDLRLESDQVLAAGDGVLVEGVLSGTLVGAFGPVGADGYDFRVHRALIARIENGKLAHLACFMNGKELAQAVGQWPGLLAK